MANKQIQQYTAALTIDGTNDLLLEYQNSSGVYKSINRNTFLGVSGTPADISSSQTFTNKVIGNTNTITVKDTLFTLQDDGDATKQAQFQLSGITTGNTRTLTVPDASLTLVGTATTQTLTNKTITSPTITGGTIDNSSITVDSISGHSTSTIVTVGGVQMNNGVVSTANSVTATSIAQGAVQPQALIAGTGTGWTFQSYVPTFTNLTVGNGTLTCNYMQVGKLVVARINFRLGSTSSVGTTPTISLPVTSVSSYVAGHWIGGMRIVSGAAGYTGYFQWGSSTTAILLALNSASTYVNDTSANFTASIPGTWANGDSFSGTIFYEAA